MQNRQAVRQPATVEPRGELTIQLNPIPRTIGIDWSLSKKWRISPLRCSGRPTTYSHPALEIRLPTYLGT